MSWYESEDELDEYPDLIEEEDEQVNDRATGFKFSIVEPDAIMDEMQLVIMEVNKIVQLQPTKTRILLQHFQWDKEKLLDSYFGGEAKLPKLPISKPSHMESPTTTNCLICFDTVPTNSLTGLECGHEFCLACWVEYLKGKIMDEGVGETICCPTYGCEVLVDDAFVVKHTNDAVRLKYQKLITNSFVQWNRLLFWCPGKDCGRACKFNYKDEYPVECKCGFISCANCHRSYHAPIKCELLRKWLKKCDDDSETSNWIAVNTKECPKCRYTIEKDGGCNHVVCKNQSCKHDFCWVCLSPWEPHGNSWYSCNRYNEKDAKDAIEAQNKSRAALSRYLHYSHRYMTHLASLNFEVKLFGLVQDKMEELQQAAGMSWIEVQFLREAVKTLTACRRTLLNTYAFAFYLKQNNQSVMFEDNQKDLEHSTELLSEYLEREVNVDKVVEMRQKIQDKLRYCDNRRMVLLNHVYEGYDKEWWVFNTAA